MTVPDGPAAAPPEPPRILRRPAPLSPAPVDIVPRNPSPPPGQRAVPIDPDGPTLIRRPAPRGESAFHEVTQPLTRMETPAVVEGLALRDPPPAYVQSAPPATATPALDTTPTKPIFIETLSSSPPPQPPPPPQPAPARPTPPQAALPQTGSPRVAPSQPAPSQPAPPQAAGLGAPPVVLVLGGGWRLALARACDSLLTLVVTAALWYGALVVLGVRPALQPIVDFAHADPISAAVALVGAPFIAVALYQAITVLLARGSIGCLLAGLRVVRMRDAARPSALRSLARGLGVAIGTLLFGCGPLWGLLIDRRRRGLGDILARTVIVRRGPDTSHKAAA